ncbi:MAG: sterol desaturase family protein [Bacteriovoracia bacterium]
MIGNRELVLVGAALVLILLGFFFPLRRFSRNQAIRHLLFHAFFSGIVLAEVAALERFRVFEGSFFSLQSLGPLWFRVLICILVLDLFSYFWHRLNHTWSWLWRWHKFHHQAEAMDPLAAYRFHPIEVFFGYQLRATLIWLLGFGADEISTFVILYGVLNLFQHSNFRIQPTVQTFLSKIVVTPNLHHVHHLRDRGSQNSNYSTIFIFWDKLFGTYTEPGVVRENDIGLDWSSK